MEKHVIGDDRKIFTINSGNQEVMRLELVFHCGIWDEPRGQIAKYTANMMKEGTSNRSASEIAETVDSYGAFLEVKPGFDRTTITLYGLTRHLPDLIPILKDVVLNPVFPKEELEILKQQGLQAHRINLRKNSYVASHNFRSHLFGSHHPYGRSTREDDILAVQPEHLQDFYHNYLRNAIIDIHFSGRFRDDDLSLIEKELGGILPGHGDNNIEYTPTGDRVDKIVISKKDSLQSSLRIGGVAIKKNHRDYLNLVVTNELLGGFFGSRLMKNIREDKGYTYGVYSQLISLKHHTYFVVSTDVKRKYRGKSIKEIRKEMQLMIDTPPSDEELDTVRNYMIGTFQSEINTPFALSDKFKSIYYHGLGYDFYEHYYEIVNSITPETVSETARKYLDPKSMLTVAVG